MLERDRPYLVPLIEELALPEDVRAKANPKSSTGRLDVFTRVITDRHHRFDDIRAGYRGKLYLEIVPRSFAIQVKTGLSLNQLRLARGDVRLDDARDPRPAGRVPAALPRLRTRCAQSELAVSDGLFLSVDLSGPGDRTVGYRAKKNSLPVDLSRIRAYRWTDYWDPVFPEPGGRIVLEPEIFYLLLSAEGVCIPPQIAAEMMAYDPTAGELRTHYAGFFDPGFGYDPAGGRHGSRAALEVRARDVSFMVEHRQPVCKLGLERMAAPAERLYGADLGSNYQGQVTMLSKHFEEQTAGTAARSGRRGQLAQQFAHPLAPRDQLVFELGDLVAAAPHQLQLAGDVAERLLEDLAAAHRVLDAVVPLAPQRRPGALGLDQLLQLLERDAEQVLQPQQLGEPLDVGLGVGAVGARLAAAGGRQQADLLVVADRPRRRPGQLGDVADPQLRRVAARSWRRLDLLDDRLLDASGQRALARGRAPLLARAQQRDAGAEQRDRRPAPRAPCACWR